ncbi:hypothetical protein PMAYCL1PPCAC_00186, partial [Pristionchus mayeri]
ALLLLFLPTAVAFFPKSRTDIVLCKALSRFSHGIAPERHSEYKNEILKLFDILNQQATLEGQLAKAENWYKQWFPKDTGLPETYARFIRLKWNDQFFDNHIMGILKNNTSEQEFNQMKYMIEETYYCRFRDLWNSEHRNEMLWKIVDDDKRGKLNAKLKKFESKDAQIPLVQWNYRYENCRQSCKDYLSGATIRAVTPRGSYGYTQSTGYTPDENPRRRYTQSTGYTPDPRRGRD